MNSKIIKVMLILLVIALVSPVLIINTQAQNGDGSNYSAQEDEDYNTWWRLRTRCFTLYQKIDQYQQNYNETNTKHLEHYQNLSQRLQAVINELKMKGRDTSKLERDLKELDKKIDNFEKYYNQYIEDLQTAKRHACNGELDEYIKSIKSALNNYKGAQAEAKDIREFVRGEIIPHLKELKD